MLHTDTLSALGRTSKDLGRVGHIIRLSTVINLLCIMYLLIYEPHFISVLCVHSVDCRLLQCQWVFFGGGNSTLLASISQEPRDLGRRLFKTKVKNLSPFWHSYLPHDITSPRWPPSRETFPNLSLALPATRLSDVTYLGIAASKKKATLKSLGRKRYLKNTNSAITIL
jgi:hypothetical protein